MVEFEYHCLAAPINITVRSEKDRANAVKVFEDLINAQARQGWEYVGMDEYLTTVPPGCFSFWKKPETTILKMLVFRKPAA